MSKKAVYAQCSPHLDKPNVQAAADIADKEWPVQATTHRSQFRVTTHNSLLPQHWTIERLAGVSSRRTSYDAIVGAREHDPPSPDAGYK